MSKTLGWNRADKLCKFILTPKANSLWGEFFGGKNDDSIRFLKRKRAYHA